MISLSTLAYGLAASTAARSMKWGRADIQLSGSMSKVTWWSAGTMDCQRRGAPDPREGDAGDPGRRRVRPLLQADVPKALALQRPFPPELLMVVATRERQDAAALAGTGPIHLSRKSP
jgi:hypothetical protein